MLKLITMQPVKDYMQSWVVFVCVVVQVSLKEFVTLAKIGCDVSKGTVK